MSWFLDLRQAFYRVVRGLLLCADLTHAGVAPILAQVKLSPEVAHDLQRHLSGEPLVSGAGATDWAAYGMCEISFRDLVQVPGQRTGHSNTDWLQAWR